MNEVRNDLLKRREVAFSVSHMGNPGFAHVTKLTADHFEVSEDTVAIKELQGKFGTDSFFVVAFIYDSAADKARIEPKPKAKKEKAA